MKFPTFKDQQIDLLVANVKEIAGISKIETNEEFKLFIFALISQYKSLKVGIDQFSSTSKYLFDNLNMNTEDVTKTFLFKTKDLAEKLRQKPYETEETLLLIMKHGTYLDKEIFNDQYILNRYPYLSPLSEDNRRIISKYLFLIKLNEITNTEDFKKLLLQIYNDIDCGLYSIKVKIDLINSLNSFALFMLHKNVDVTLLNDVINATKIENEIEKIEEKSEQITNIQSRLHGIIHNIRIEFGQFSEQNEITYELVVPYQNLKIFKTEIQKEIFTVMQKANLKSLSTRSDLEKYFLKVVDLYQNYELRTNDLAYYFGWLDALCSGEYSLSDRFYGLIHSGSDLDWDALGINTLTLQEILVYAEELRK